MIASKRGIHRRRQAQARRDVEAMMQEAVEAKAPCLDCGKPVTQGDFLPMGRPDPIIPVCHKRCNWRRQLDRHARKPVNQDIQ